MTTLTVCGSSGSYPGVARACSSYLLRDGDDQILLDIGNGSLANVQRWVSLESVRNIFISHGHHDHFGDLVGLMQFTSFGQRPPDRVRVFTNGPTIDTLREVQQVHAHQDQALHLVEVSPGNQYRCGSFLFEVFPALHSRPAQCLRIQDSAGRVIAYTGDSALSDDVIQCAQGANLLISEATWLAGSGVYPPNVHMTGSEAGELARLARVDQLLVTHVWPEFSANEVAAQAATSFGGPTLVAQDNLILEIGK